MSITAQPTITRLVEQIYADEADEQVWLDGIRQHAEAAFDLPGQAFTAHVEPDGRAEIRAAAGEEMANELMLRFHSLASSDALRALYFSGPVVLSGLGVLNAARDKSMLEGHLQQMGVPELCGTIGIGPEGGVAAIVLFPLERPRVMRRQRVSLERLAAHLATAVRLRGRADPAVAVLSPQGKLLDAPDDAFVQAHGAGLRAAALAIDRAHATSGTDPDVALGYWTAMVEGRWTLVERIDQGGRRVFVARRNEPATRNDKALTPMERSVVALSALCHPNKLVAYELGISERATSLLLASAIRKLGVRNRSELIALHGALVGSAAPAELAPSSVSSRAFG